MNVLLFQSSRDLLSELKSSDGSHEGLSLSGRLASSIGLAEILLVPG